MISSALLLVIFIILLFVYLYKFSKNRPENFPPGPPRLPFWGSYWFMLKENYTFTHLSLETLAKYYKTDILGLHLGDSPAVATLSYDLCKEVLTREEFVGRNDSIVARTRASGDLRGIFFVDGPFWKEQRRFSLRYMRDYGFGRRSENMENFVAEEVRYLIDFLNSEPKENDGDVCKEKGRVLMPDVLYGSLINSILLVLSSTRFDNNRQLRDCARAVHTFLSSVDATGCALSMTPWVRFVAPTFFKYTAVKESHDILLKFVENMVDEHIRTFSDDHHRDFIDVYISETKKEGYDLDYKQLTLIVLDYMFPSPVAIGNTITYYINYMIDNPQIQNNVQEELDRVVGRSRLPTLDDRKLLHYFEASIREVIRIFPLTPLGVARRCVKDTMLAGYFVPKDTIILPCLWTAHRDKKIWTNPEEFQPERFLDEEGNLLKKDYTIGFGAGKRLCAGETFARNTLFLVLSGLLQNFTFKSATGKHVGMDVFPGLAVSSKENWVTVEAR